MSAPLLVAVLATLQLAALRATQHFAPRLYFTTATLFETASDVTWGAIAARLAIPLATGILTAFLAPADAAFIAGAAGGVAWFLAIWPMLWAPAQLSQAWTRGLAAALVAFQLAFVALPVLGVSLAFWLQRTLTADGTAVQQQVAVELAVALPLAVLWGAASALASRRVAREHGNRPWESDFIPEEDDWRPTRSERAAELLRDPRVSAASVAATVFAVCLSIWTARKR